MNITEPRYNHCYYCSNNMFLPYSSMMKYVNGIIKKNGAMELLIMIAKISFELNEYLYLNYVGLYNILIKRRRHNNTNSIYVGDDAAFYLRRNFLRVVDGSSKSSEVKCGYCGCKCCKFHFDNGFGIVSCALCDEDVNVCGWCEEGIHGLIVCHKC